jgi:hypothetical protein
MRRLAATPLAAALVAAAVPLTGCGRENRTATLGLNPQTVRVDGASADQALEEELARKGFANATVGCAQTIIAHVGATVTCGVSGAGSNRSVRFTFRNSRGEIDSATVEVSS